MKTEYLDEFQVSPRVVLRRGDKFRVSAGPYWRLGDGTKVRLAARGVCTFIRAQRRGGLVLIEARDGDGHCVLHVAGRRRSKVDAALVCRPYRIKGRVRQTGGRR